MYVPDPPPLPLPDPSPLPFPDPPPLPPPDPSPLPFPDPPSNIGLMKGNVFSGAESTMCKFMVLQITKTGLF